MPSLHFGTYLTLFAALLFSGCRGNVATSAETAACVQNFDPQKDYFPEKTTLEDAKNFSVEYHRSYKVVTILQTSQGGGTEREVLVQCGAPKPNLTGDLASASVVSIPVKSMFSASTTHQPLLTDLNRLDVLTGIPEKSFAVNEEILARIKTGKIVEYAPNSVINAELVVSQAPSLMMVVGGDSPSYSVIRNAGIPVVSNAEWLEQTALGRAEWIKFMALFLNEEGTAQRLYSSIRKDYMELAARTRNIPRDQRPKVMTGGLYRGIYSVSGGRSYVARMIEDAGGDYVWADNKDPGIATIDIETAITRASDADIWINGFSWPNLAAMLKDEPRYREFKAYRTGQVWLYDRRVTDTGAYDYWSRGITRPDLILADLIKIFHPDLAKDHEFEWYRQVPAAPAVKP